MMYYYSVNAQGDVTGIFTATGTEICRYVYDAWGRIVYQYSTSGYTITTLNPLRYRGYVYDTETELYYLQSRYYNPEWGRFINADALVSTGQGLLGNNMFAYCLNNPSNRIDVGGSSSIAIKGKNDIGPNIQALDGGGSVGLLVIVVVALSTVITSSATSKTKTEHKALIDAAVQIEASSEGSHTVYFLHALGDPNQAMVYVGRVKTENFYTRMSYHRSKGRALSAYIS